VSARVPYSPYLSSARSGFRRLVRRLRREYAYASLLATDCAGTRFEVRRGQVSVLDSRWNERGCVVRVHDGTGYREASFNRQLAPEQVLRLLEGTAGGGARMEYPVHREAPLRRRWRSSVRLLPQAAGPERILARLVDLRDRAFARSSLLADVRLGFEAVTVRKLFLSGGRELEQAYLWSQGSLVPGAARGGHPLRARSLLRAERRGAAGRDGRKTRADRGPGRGAAVGRQGQPRHVRGDPLPGNRGAPGP
jgi:TldD protein